MSRKNKIKEGSKNKELLIHAKRLSKRVLMKYIKFAVVIIALQIMLLGVFWMFDSDVGTYFSLAFVTIDALVTLTFFVIFDAVPARKIKKNNFRVDGSKITKEQGIVFYNSLKLRTVYRTGFNILATLVIVAFSILYLTVH